MKYAVVTFGCRVNQAESLAMEGALRASGATPVVPDEADLVLVNTCAVTASAEQGARQVIRRLARVNPGVRVVVTGCYTTRRPEDMAALPGVVRVVRNDSKDGLVDGLAADGVVGPGGDGDGPCGTPLVPGTGGRTALTLRVQTGCEEACSYCIIPSTRGASRSHSLDDVAGDIHAAVAAGYKEIVITGVHLGSYGRDLRDGSSVAVLLRMLAEWPADVLFRVSSLEPMDCTPELVEIVASSPRLAPHFHLPLQHGSDAVLRAMRRPYTVSHYRALVDRIRARLPHASLGSDIIVGFPGETAGQVDEMVHLLERLPLTHLHVFPYSDRPGTAASRMPGKVAGGEIRARGRRVRAVGERLARRFQASQVGRVLRGLTVSDGHAVVTGNYLKLRLDRPRARNEWVSVEVLDGQRARAVSCGTTSGNQTRQLLGG